MKAASSGTATASIADPGEIVSIETGDRRQLRGRHWRASGGRLLLAAHGVMSHGLWFHQLAAALRRHGIALLAFDRRGAGLNRDDPGEPGDDRRLIDDLAGWMDFAATMSDELHLLGFCWGSNYLLHGLGDRPQDVRSLILMAPGVATSPEIALHRSIDDLDPQARLPIPLPLEDFTRGAALDGFLRPDPLRLTHTSARFVGIQQTIGRWSAARLIKLRLPLLAILAADDAISDNAKTRGLIAKSRAAPKKVVEVPGRHGVIFDAPDAAAAACADWLACPAGSRS